MKSKYSPNFFSPGTSQICSEKLTRLSTNHPGLCPLRTTLPTLKISRISLTLSTPDGVDIDEGFKLSRAQGPMGMDVATDTLRRGAIGAHQSRRSSQATVPIPLGGFLLPHRPLLLWFRAPNDVMDAQQKAVVHDLQLY